MEFVTFEDAKNRLGKTDAELQEMVKKGELRAFRDGGTWKFRKEDIDTKAGGAPAEAGAKEAAGDTLMSIDADILFAEEEEVPADSAAETWIAADTEGVFPGKPAKSPEATKGVEKAMKAPETEPAPLALSPETDESSLGAVLSDEELGAAAPPAEEPAIAVDTGSGVASVISAGSSVTATATAMAPSRTHLVMLIEPPAHHAQFTFMLALTVIALGFAVFAIEGLLAGSVPDFMKKVATENTPLIITLVGAFVVGIAALVGYFLDKQRVRREALGGK